MKYTLITQTRYPLPEESIIIPVALVTESAIIPRPSDCGTFKLILNISSPSTISSLITGTLTVVVVAPAGIVAVREVESKSISVILYQ